MKEKCKECIWHDEEFNSCIRKDIKNKKCKYETSQEEEIDFIYKDNEYKLIQFYWVGMEAKKVVAKWIFKNGKEYIHAGYGGDNFITKEEAIDWVALMEDIHDEDRRKNQQVGTTSE